MTFLFANSDVHDVLLIDRIRDLTRIRNLTGTRGHATLPRAERTCWSPVRFLVRFPRVHWETGARRAAARGCPRTFTESHRARCSSPSLRVSTWRECDSFDGNDNIKSDEGGDENSRCIILPKAFPLFRKTRGPPNVAPPNLAGVRNVCRSVNDDGHKNPRNCPTGKRRAVLPARDRSLAKFDARHPVQSTLYDSTARTTSRVRKFKSAAPRPATRIDRSVDLTSTAAAMSATSTSTGDRYHPRTGCVTHCSR